MLVSPALRDLLRAPLAEGLLVEIAEPGSPAAGAGVRGGDLDVVISGEPFLVGGDVITAINGTPVGTAKVLAVALSSLRVGERVTLTLSRGGETRTLDLVVHERPVPRQDLPESRLDNPAARVARPSGRAARFASATHAGF